LAAKLRVLSNYAFLIIETYSDVKGSRNARYDVEPVAAGGAEAPPDFRLKPEVLQPLQLRKMRIAAREAPNSEAGGGPRACL
jgi:hypothetical protein